MTKKIFMGLALAAGLWSCTEDYTDWESTQKNDSNDPVQKFALAIQPTVQAIDFATEKAQTIQLFTTNAGDKVDGYALEFTANDTDKSATINATPDGKVTAADLIGVVKSIYGNAPEERTFNVAVATDVTISTADGDVKARKTATPFTLKAKLEASYIAPAYYVVGGTLDWAASAASKEQKFSHSDKSVYDDPVFTITIPASSGDTWFAIGDDEALDAITNNGDWSKLLGTTAGNGDTSLTGTLAPRSELGNEGSICMPGSLGASFFKITINMEEYSYEITPVVIAAQYYVVGDVQGWSDSKKTCLFTPGENNILSYTTKWKGEYDLKIWDANSFGNWDAAWGCAVDGDNSPSGNLINSGAQAISAPSAEFYTFTIDLNTMTYTWTKLANQSPTEYTNISLIGEFNGWGGDFELEQVTPHNWYAIYTQAADGQLKFRANHDWSTNWGFGNDMDWNVTDAFNKIGSNGAGNIFVPAGTYAVYLNDITGSMMFVAQ